jgi:hypothetical protein
MTLSVLPASIGSGAEVADVAEVAPSDGSVMPPSCQVRLVSRP